MRSAFFILLILFSVRAAVFAEVTGPVVGFVRIEVEVGKGPQRIEPAVRPSQTTDDETAAQALSDYLGEEFLSGDDAINADWIGLELDDDGVTDIAMLWKDQRGQWHDMLGNPVEPECTDASTFWLDLAFDETADAETRELVLSGEMVW